MVAQLHRGLSYEEYCALPGVNSSLLKEIDKSTLAHAKAVLDGTRIRTSDALDFGHSFHELLLRDREEFVVHPETYAAPKEHTKVKKGEIPEGFPLPWIWTANICKEWAKPHAGKIIHTAEEAANIRAMTQAVRANAELSPYLTGDTEVCITGERKGAPLKCLIDLLPTDGPVIDFKKCRSASPRMFVGDALKLGYHLQAAFYLDLLAQTGDRRSSFWFVAVEDSAPYAVTVVKFSDTPLSLLRVGRAHYRAAFDKLMNAQQTGEWPAYASCDAEDYAPNWMKEELERVA